jgi:predicted permease
MVSSLLHDLRYAFRGLARTPGFTLTALLTLAIGIGANTAIFTLVHGVLLKPLAVANPSQLYKFGDEYKCCNEGGLQNNWSMFAYPFYLYARDHTPAFEQLAAAGADRPFLSVRRTGAGAPAEPVSGEFVSGNYFDTLGVSTIAGRTLSPTDDETGAAPVAVLSYGAWERLYGLDRSIVGNTLIMNGIPVTLIGVAPPAFFGDRLEGTPPSFWMPLASEPAFRRENSLLHATSAAWLYILGRLRPDARPAQLSAQLTTELRQYLLTPGNGSSHQDLKQIGKQQIRLSPGGGGINAMKNQYEQGLLLLMAASAALLMIACGNLANLLLARGAATHARTALQLAIGASRARIVRGELTESLVLSVLGGAAGLLVAFYASRSALLIAFRGSVGVPISTSPSPVILIFTFLASLATGIVFGVGPAWIASRAHPADALRGVNRVTHDASALSQRSLVVLQAALLMVLLTVAGLLTQSLRNLENQSYGFDRQGRLVVRINPQSAGYTQDRLAALYQSLQDRMARMPAVISASLSLYTAQQGNNWGEDVFFPGKAEDLDSNGTSWDRVSAHYFETIGTPVVRGRGIDERDTAGSRRVAVINEAFARKYFANEDPIGQYFGKGDSSHAGDYEIVGVSKDAKYREASRPVQPMFFVPLLQKIVYAKDADSRVEDASMYIGSIELHVNREPSAVMPEVRRLLAGVDPNLTPMSMRTFDELVGLQTTEQTLIARLSEAFGLVALLLASVGLYGVTAFRVAGRTKEVGLRMALGASRQDIVSLVLRGAFSQVALGLLVGIPLALLARQWLQHQLFGIPAFDPWSLTLAILVLGLCAFVASLLPAGRAARINPAILMRTE